VGQSNTGKTNMVLSTLAQGDIKYNHIYLYTKHPNQDKYKKFVQVLNQIEKNLGLLVGLSENGHASGSRRFSSKELDIST